MAVYLLDDLLKNYDVSLPIRYTNAVREIMQQTILAGLHRGGFFEKAAFYGGTALRLCYGLDRFSEDMDFTLILPDPEFTLEPWFPYIKQEFLMLGHEQVTITRKEKKGHLTFVDSAFLKDTTELYNLQGGRLPQMRIKIEIDTDPPLDFWTTLKPVHIPYSFMVHCYALESAYAGKMSALLYRQWKNRVKGRDWYDFEWYVRQGVALDLIHFNARAKQGGHISEDLTPGGFRTLLKEKISSSDIAKVKAELSYFVEDIARLDHWTLDYFLQLADQMKIDDCHGAAVERD
ncbi:MAG: nucleotidyl transferase AbiEii/AbiGii toxin family protein [Clostridiales Family XIII bacterium]|jgi:hypothetical protein|nr:nucleotidyl transferase AbiEii/AbiGii toxin family protein [Clostridiales Family XIII bacterium]